MTSCDESADSVNVSPVAKSNFVVIAEAGVENKAVTTEENPIINTLFSLHLAVLQLMMSLTLWMLDKSDAKHGMETIAALSGHPHPVRPACNWNLWDLYQSTRSARSIMIKWRKRVLERN